MLKDNGIGRPSTRANIIETLFRRKYIEKKKKNLFATQTGMDLIDTIQNELLKSPELTGDWERKLRLIEKGEYEPALFKKELIKMVTDLTNEVKSGKYRSISIGAPSLTSEPIPVVKKTKAKIDLDALSCPKCREHKLIKGNTAYGCVNFKVCKFILPFRVYSKVLTKSQINELVTNGTSKKINGFVLDDGTAQSGKLKFDHNFQIILE